MPHDPILPHGLSGPTRWRFDQENGLWLSMAACSWFDLAEFPPAAWKQILLPKLAVADRSRLIEALLRGLDGQPIDVQIASLDSASSRMLRWIADASDDGRSVGGMLLDVSRDAREREALIELAGLQRSFIDALPWPACAYDEAGDVLLANRLWRRCADCTVHFDDAPIRLPELPEWLCRHRGDFSGGTAGERSLTVMLRSSEGLEQPARLHRASLRQSGTPLNVLSIESRPTPGSRDTDQEDAGSDRP